jgi:LysR family transcriptional regulator, pca operon transcriptional activator
MKLDLHRLRHVMAVAETRSFSRAAELLGITQPALSRSIATLEEDLGLRIFDRGRSGVFITQAGADLIVEAERLLAQAQAMEQNLLQIRNAESGVIKFGMAPIVASIFLPRLLTRLTKAHPGLVLRPLVRKAEDLLGALTSGQVELYFIAAAHLPPLDYLTATKIGTVPVGMFARAGHPLTHKPSLDVDDLRFFPFAASVAEFPGRTGGPPVVTSIVCDNYFLMKELILTSDTICLMSPLLLQEELRTGKAVRLDVGLIEQTNFDLSALRMVNRTESPSAKLVLDHFVKIVQDLS